MTHKIHLQAADDSGPVCLGGKKSYGRHGPLLAEDHLPFAARPLDVRCGRCSKSLLFTYLQHRVARKSL